MAARTTTEMLDALAEAVTSIKAIDDKLGEVMPTSTVEKFWEAMRMAGVESSRADEYFHSLDHASKVAAEGLHSLIREFGAMQHIIAAGVHKSPNRAGNHLVL